jgi:anti-sigma B factor antagonist
VILDLSKVPYMDSAGLGSILNAHVSCSNSGRRLALAAVPDRVLTLLRVSRVDQVLAIFPTLQEAQEKMA